MIGGAGCRGLGLVAALLLPGGLGIAPAQSASDAPCVLDRCDHPITQPSAPATPPPAPQAEPTADPDAEPQAPDPPAAPAPRGNPAAGNFDFYVLALSWSPSFCETGAASHAPQQCAAGAKLGFVVHGLWPQNEHGWPQDCNSAQFPTRAQIDAIHGLYPDDGLARHEWRAHGACSGLSPTAYFAAVRTARQSITVPDAYGAPDAEQTVAPRDVGRAFLAANPRLRLDALAVTCRSGALEEVRVCFSKDLRQFHACPEVTRAACRSSQVTMPPVR